MTYSELKDFAESKKISLQKIAETIEMTARGMQTSFENQT